MQIEQKLFSDDSFFLFLCLYRTIINLTFFSLPTAESSRNFIFEQWKKFAIQEI